MARSNNNNSSSNKTKYSFPSQYTELQTTLASDHFDSNAKISALHKEFISLLNHKKRIEKQVFDLERKSQELTTQRDNYQSQLTKAILAKSTLESLCRELQKHSRAVSDDTKIKVTEEKIARKEVAAQFQTQIDDITTQMQEQHDRNLKLERENAELKAILEQFDRKEIEIRKLFERKDIDNKILETKISQLDLILAQEKETAKAEREILVLQLTEKHKSYQDLAIREAEMKREIEFYTNKFQEVQETMTKSGEAFEIFKKELDKKDKIIKKLENDREILIKKYETFESSNKLQKERLKELKRLTNKNATLENLCRALQDERTTLKVKIEYFENSYPKILNVDCNNQSSAEIQENNHLKIFDDSQQIQANASPSEAAQVINFSIAEEKLELNNVNSELNEREVKEAEPEVNKIRFKNKNKKSETNKNKSKSSTNNKKAKSTNFNNKLELTNGDVERLEKLELTNGDVESLDKPELANGDVEQLDKLELTNGDVESSDKSDLTNGDVESLDNLELTNGEAETLDNLELTNDEAEPLDKLELTNGEVEDINGGDKENGSADMLKKLTNNEVSNCQNDFRPNIPPLGMNSDQLDLNYTQPRPLIFSNIEAELSNLDANLASIYNLSIGISQIESANQNSSVLNSTTLKSNIFPAFVNESSSLTSKSDKNQENHVSTVLKTGALLNKNENAIKALSLVQNGLKPFTNGLDSMPPVLPPSAPKTIGQTTASSSTTQTDSNQHYP